MSPPSVGCFCDIDREGEKERKGKKKKRTPAPGCIHRRKPPTTPHREIKNQKGNEKKTEKRPPVHPKSKKKK